MSGADWVIVLSVAVVYVGILWTWAIRRAKRNYPAWIVPQLQEKGTVTLTIRNSGGTWNVVWTARHQSLRVRQERSSEWPLTASNRYEQAAASAMKSQPGTSGHLVCPELRSHQVFSPT
jgi:hypothetical protein